MILIVDKSKKNARSLADIFYYMGILATGVTPKEAHSEISSGYRAVIVTTPDTLASVSDFTERLKSYRSDAIYLSLSNERCECSELFDINLPYGTPASVIYEKLLGYARENEIQAPGIYRLAGIDCSANLPRPEYFSEAMPFTKTEGMILKTLIRAYPNPMPASDILKYAFRESRVPEISNVRTHVSVMNKKFRTIAGRNLITLSRLSGYTVMTPELCEATT